MEPIEELRMSCKVPEDYRGDRTKVDWTAVTNVSKYDFVKDDVSGSDAARIKFYDENASAYEEDMNTHEYAGPREVADAVHKYLEGNVEAEILDVGCGSGLVTHYIRMKADYQNIDGLDASEGLLAIGREKGRFRNTFLKYFYRNCGLDEEHYDAVVTCGTFVPGHLKADSIYEFHRILKKGGIMIVAMRKNFLDKDEDLCKIPGILEELTTEGKLEKLESSTYEGHFSAIQGALLVFKKC